MKQVFSVTPVLIGTCLFLSVDSIIPNVFAVMEMTPVYVIGTRAFGLTTIICYSICIPCVSSDSNNSNSGEGSEDLNWYWLQ